jgi:hypothetical protein
MHLVQAGVNLIYLRDLLGHADVSTTEIYADMTIKERALARTASPSVKPGRYRPPDQFLAFLESLRLSDRGCTPTVTGPASTTASTTRPLGSRDNPGIGICLSPGPTTPSVRTAGPPAGPAVSCAGRRRCPVPGAAAPRRGLLIRG